MFKKLFVFMLAVFLMMSSMAEAQEKKEYIEAETVGNNLKIDDDGDVYATDRVIVKFSKGTSENIKDKIKSNNGIVKSEKLNEELELLYNDGNIPVEAMKTLLEKNPNVSSINYDFIRTADEFVPDSLELVNTIQTSDLWGLDMIDAQEAWNLTMGSTGTSDAIIVAVIDTGIQTNHEDLATNMWKNTNEIAGNNIDDDNNGFVDDYEGWDFSADRLFDDQWVDGSKVYFDSADDRHGTHVAGTIAGINNDIGVIGVAPKVKIMPLRFLYDHDNDDSTGSTGYDSDAIRAIAYAEANGADVINASWGGGGENDDLLNVINDFAGVFVAAAGNGGSDGRSDDNDLIPHYPSSYPNTNIISVAAVNSPEFVERYNFTDPTITTEVFAHFSNYGIESVDVAAPGGYGLTGDGSTYISIYSTIPESSYTGMNGTSMATPHVSGIVALMLSTGNYDSSTPAEVVQAVLDSAVPHDNLTGRIKTGAIVNAYNAITYMSPVEYTLNVAAPINGTITPDSGSYTHSENTSITFEATPAEGYMVDRWTVDDITTEPDAISANQLTLVMDGDHDVAVYFKPSYTLTVVEPANATISPATSGFGQGDVVTLTATLAYGYEVENWEVDGVLYDGDDATNLTYTLTMDSNKTVTLVLKKRIFTLTVDVPAEGGDIENGSTGALGSRIESYAYETQVTLDAIPDESYEFVEWMANEDHFSYDDPVTFSLLGDYQITAVFASTYNLTVGTPLNGTLSLEPGVYSYSDSETVTLTATADEVNGYELAYWLVDDIQAGNNASIDILMDGPHSVNAVFALGQHQLTVAQPENGSITPGTATYTYGQAVELTATADYGYHFEHWTGDGSGSQNPIVLNVTGEMTVSADIEPNMYVLSRTSTEGGTITSNPAGDSYAYNTEVTLTAMAKEGYEFTGWSGAVIGFENPITVTVTDNMEVVANFEKATLQEVLIEVDHSGLSYTGPDRKGEYAVSGPAVVTVTQGGVLVTGYDLYGYWTLAGVAEGDASYLGTTDNGVYEVRINKRKLTFDPYPAVLVIESGTVEPDTTAPVYVSNSLIDPNYVPVDTTEMSLVFDETLVLGAVADPISLTDASSNNISIGAPFVSGNTLTVPITGVLNPETGYTLLIPGDAVEDVSGNVFGGTTIRFTTAAASSDISLIVATVTYNDGTPPKVRGKYTFSNVDVTVVAKDASDQVVQGTLISGTLEVDGKVVAIFTETTNEQGQVDVSIAEFTSRSENPVIVVVSSN